MGANNHKRRHLAMRGLCLFSFFLIAPSIASAQSETPQPPFVWSVAKSVLLDPTTYAPAALSYTALRMDWNSSQPLFRAGYVEQNHLFTVSGRSNDTPIGTAQETEKSAGWRWCIWRNRSSTILPQTCSSACWRKNIRGIASCSRR